MYELIIDNEMNQLVRVYDLDEVVRVDNGTSYYDGIIETYEARCILTLHRAGVDIDPSVIAFRYNINSLSSMNCYEEVKFFMKSPDINSCLGCGVSPTKWTNKFCDYRLCSVQCCKLMGYNIPEIVSRYRIKGNIAIPNPVDVHESDKSYNYSRLMARYELDIISLCNSMNIVMERSDIAYRYNIYSLKQWIYMMYGNGTLNDFFNFMVDREDNSSYIGCGVISRRWLYPFHSNRICSKRCYDDTEARKKGRYDRGNLINSYWTMNRNHGSYWLD